MIEFVTWYFVLFWPAYVFAAAGLAAIWPCEWAGFKIWVVGQFDRCDKISDLCVGPAKHIFGSRDKLSCAD